MILRWEVWERLHGLRGNYQRLLPGTGTKEPKGIAHVKSAYVLLCQTRTTVHASVLSFRSYCTDQVALTQSVIIPGKYRFRVDGQ